jgi:hypothetical protein
MLKGVTPGLKLRGSPGERPRRKGPEPPRLEKGLKPPHLRLKGGKNQFLYIHTPKIHVSLPSSSYHHAQCRARYNSDSSLYTTHNTTKD